MTSVAIQNRSITKSFLLLLLGAYRTIGTSFFGGSCRFHPSCSAYAVEAVEKHRPMVAIRLIAKRIARCRPGGPFGDDPVPEAVCGCESRYSTCIFGPSKRPEENKA